MCLHRGAADAGPVRPVWRPSVSVLLRCPLKGCRGTAGGDGSGLDSLGEISLGDGIRLFDRVLQPANEGIQPRRLH